MNSFLNMIVCVLCIIFCSHYGFAEEIQTLLSKNKIGLNESFSIVFATDKKIQERPDFSPLEKDFDILSTSSGFSASIINQVIKEEASWALILMPKKEGELLVPPIKFGADYSSQKTIEVMHTDFVPRDEALFIETSLYPEKNVYEQTALIFTIRLYCSLQIAQGTLSDPKVNDPDAFIEQLGSDSQYEIWHQNGMKYNVVERKYVIVPSKALEFEVSPIIFEGAVVKAGRSFFNAQTDFKRVFSKSEKIQVLPPAMPLKNPWFAANDVKIFEGFTTDLKSITLGEPVSWDLIIKAEGALGNQIPDLKFELPKGVKHYVDKSEITNELNGDQLTGIKRIKVALIPMQAGEFSLPEIVLQWWDLKANQMQETRLAAKTIVVTAEEIAMNEVIPVKEENLISLLDVKSETVEHDSFLRNSVIAALFSLVIISVYFYLRPVHDDSFNKIKKKFKCACIKNDAKEAEKYFLLLADQLFKGIRPLNLMTIKSYLPKNLQDELYLLYEVLYGKKTGWEGKKLWKVFSSFKPVKPKIKEEGPSSLQPLYPKS